MRNKIIKLIATLTRKFCPRGTEQILRLIYNPDKRQNDFLETIIPYDGDLKIHINTSSFIEWIIFFKGYYDLLVIRLIKKYLPRGGVFVEVGANIGDHSLIASKIAKKVIAIEPVNYLCDRLRENCKLNRIKNISIVPLAVSKEKTVSVFFPQTANQGGGSLYKTNDAELKEIKAASKPLDEILKGEERIDLIQMDVVGHDGKIILDSYDTISRHRPIIIFEFNKRCWELAGTDLKNVLEFLKSFNYSFKKIGKGNSGFNVLCLPD